MKITADYFFTTSDGIHIYFEDRGSGLPIVMVPGFLCTTKFYEKNAEVLSKEFRVITMDPRGQGNSSKTCQGNTIRRNAQDIKELIDQLGLEHVVLLTVVVFVLLFTTKLPNYFIFMLGCVFALVVNFPDPKEQEARLAAHAPKAISLVATVLAAGVMVGILNNTGMIVAMAEFIINILPAALAKHLHLVFAFLGGFIGLAVSPDPLYYGILPVLIEVCGNYGIPATSVAIAFGVGADSCFTMAPVIASTYLGLAVSGMSLKDVMKTNFLPHWIIGLIMIVFGCLIGTIVV